MNVTIDVRERDLIDQLESYGNGRGKGQFSFDTKSLDVADIQFTNDDGIVCVIERKTYCDLAASIQEGRYHEQKKRLMALDAPMKAYLIEGQPQGKYHGRITPSAIQSAILGTGLRDGFTIIPSSDVSDTASIVVKLAKKLPSFLAEQGKGMSNCKYVKALCSSVSTQKKANIDGKTCAIMQLSQIPGLSTTIATELINQYKSVKALIAEYDTDPDFLDEIRVNNRRLGKNVKANLKSYLFTA